MAKILVRGLDAMGHVSVASIAKAGD